MKQVSKKFYRSIGNGKFKPCPNSTAVPSPEGLPGLEMFIRYLGSRYDVYEAKTGYPLAHETTQEDAIAAATLRIRTYMATNYQERIEQSILETGLSPRYEADPPEESR